MQIKSHKIRHSDQKYPIRNIFNTSNYFLIIAGNGISGEQIPRHTRNKGNGQSTNLDE